MRRSWNIICLYLLCLCASHAQDLRPAAFAQNTDAAPVEINNAAVINSAEIEFSPTFYEQGIVFPTARKKQGLRDKKINSTFFELYYTDLDPNGDPLKPRAFSPEINSLVHEGPVSFSQDGNRIFFTRNNSEKGLRKADKSGLTRMQIYTARKGKYDWEGITALPFNADHYSCVHPCWDEQAQRLYFASNMVDGQGGYDLYYADWRDSSWSEAVNLGAEINTTQNEQFPFYHPSGILFFTSDGFMGYGGLDMYMIDTKGIDRRIINLGEPFNSTYDDLGMIISQSGTTGFFSSDRPGGKGRDDIFRFTAPNGIGGRTLPPKVSLPVLIEDAGNGSSIADAAIRIFEKRGDQYFQKDRSLFESVLIPKSEDGPQLIFRTLRRDLSQMGSPDVITDRNGTARLDLKGFEDYVLLIHADGYETKEYKYGTDANESPATERIALTPRNCLTVKGGIFSSLTKGTITNALIHIKMLSTGTDKVIMSNGSGRYQACLDYAEKYEITAYKENFEEQTAVLQVKEHEGNRFHTQDFTLSPLGSRLSKGHTIVLENIYYDFDKYQIRAGAALELEELAQLMRVYPSMQVRLEAHTDSRGSSSYNFYLSQKRAESARQYLLARQISPERVSTRGMGESRLRNHCRDGQRCSELEHQYNRRTEVIITGMDKPVPIRYQLNPPKTIGGK